MNPISGMSDVPGLDELLKATRSSSGNKTDVSFKDFMLQSIEKVNSMQAAADTKVQTMMVGGEVEPAKVLSAVQQADMSFRLLQQIRNKLVQAYQEIKDIRI